MSTALPTIKTDKAAGLKLKWKKNLDMSPNLLEYYVEHPSHTENKKLVKIEFNPARSKPWSIFFGNEKIAKVDGLRTDVQAMQGLAEEYWEKALNGTPDKTKAA